MGLFFDELLHNGFPMSKIDYTLYEKLILFEQDVVNVTLVGLDEYFVAFFGDFLNELRKEVSDELMLNVMDIIFLELLQFWDDSLHDILNRVIATFFVVSKTDYILDHLEHKLTESNNAVELNMLLNLFTGRLSSQRKHNTFHQLNLLLIILVFNI